MRANFSHRLSLFEFYVAVLIAVTIFILWPIASSLQYIVVFEYAISSLTADIRSLSYITWSSDKVFDYVPSMLHRLSLLRRCIQTSFARCLFATLIILRLRIYVLADSFLIFQFVCHRSLRAFRRSSISHDSHSHRDLLSDRLSLSIITRRRLSFFSLSLLGGKNSRGISYYSLSRVTNGRVRLQLK